MYLVAPDVDSVSEFGHVLMACDIGDGQTLVACYIRQAWQLPKDPF